MTLVLLCVENVTTHAIICGMPLMIFVCVLEVIALARINSVQHRFHLPCSMLYHISSLTTDTTSAMSGLFGGLQALLEKARRFAMESPADTSP